ncbi:MAG: gamma-glutamyltransferase [Parvicellaceae bacterium]
MFHNLSIFLFALLILSCQNQKINKNHSYDGAMVVSAHPIASEVGLEIIASGGNAADAAIAVQMALAVVYPSAGNIGGGGFFVYRTSEGESNTLDFREKAPKAAHEKMYIDSLGKVIEDLSLVGHMAIGVPGTVDGMVEVHKKYGSLSWEELIQPAIDLAENGFALTKKEANNLNYFNNKKVLNPNSENPYYSDEHKEGDSLILIDLSKTLSEIKNNKKHGFYSGWVANKMIDEIRTNGGIMNLDDLANYQSIWRKPIESNYKNYKLISMGPPSSGGILLAQMLEMISHYPIKKLGFHSKKTIHLMAEIERRAFADRSEHLADPDFYEVKFISLLDSLYLTKRIDDINFNKATLSTTVSPGEFISNESDETTHFSIVDNQGNAASVTTTLNASYGSGVIVKGAGFLLNNEMDDFSIQPGYPNLYGLIGGQANAIQPEKRMLSSMTPTILEKNGGLFMVLGSPGGSTIITAVFQTILNVIEFGMSMDSAVNVTRFHHQWLPDQIKLENKMAKDSILISELKALGHNIKLTGSMNRVDAILVDNGVLYGGADRRGDDCAKGF